MFDLLGGIAHHVDENHHIFAFVKQLDRLHRSHHVYQSRWRAQEYINSGSIHRVVNDLVLYVRQHSSIEQKRNM